MGRFNRFRIRIFWWHWILARKKVNPNPPYIFTLRSLNSSEIKRIKAVSEVSILHESKDSLKFSWQPWTAELWKWGRGKRRPTTPDAAMRMFPLLALSNDIGRYKFERTTNTSTRSSSIVKGSGSNQFNCAVDYKNFSLRLYMFAEALPGQIEHEMLRHLPGKKIRIENCGGGFILVVGEGKKLLTCWQVSSQSFASISNIFFQKIGIGLRKALGKYYPSGY